MSRRRVAIIGSGNIGTDLMFKILRGSNTLEVVAMIGVDPASDGLARARRAGVATCDRGVEGFLDMPEARGVDLVFDATSATSHQHNDAILAPRGIRLVDLTPAAIGPFVVPSVNLDTHLDAPNLNMVTCGGQATIPIVAAVARASPVHYAEIIASIASRSAGPGTRANIDEFTQTTARAIELIGGAARGKAIITLNPAEPPITMRDTVLCLCDHADPEVVRASVVDMVAAVAAYVPGYRMKHDVQIETVSEMMVPGKSAPFSGLKISVFLEVLGAAHYLPAYAGNLDIMTSAALQVAERVLSDEKVST
ncbi:acetaldehyde dehydrogenase (acetylating) [Roseovarius sp.]|uniref:acetaldehyde dehydrogenase (acetylating) n=1 Tax=Roseovarius sp. TaxID=1486281 RepID=UPI0035678846